MFDNRPPDGSADNEEPDGREQISWLRSLGDREALFQFMDSEGQTEQGLEAAEALVELGDVRGLDHLIASLRSANSTLRHQAAQILKQLNHPRGLRALREFRDEPGSRTATAAGAKPEAPREKLHDDLEALDTDELVALWHEKDRSRMSELALDVLSEILTERLGELPPEEGDAEDRIDQDVDPRVRDLWMQGDTKALMRIFEDAPDIRLQLEAAEALADLGDDDALDVLIEALDDPDRQINETAAELLDWLDLPRGNQALADRGIEFETGASDLLDTTGSALESSSRDEQPSAPALSSWVAGPPPPQTPGFPRTQVAAEQPVWHRAEGSSGMLLGSHITGAVGGLIGFMVFQLGLHVLGMKPLPQDLAGWLQLGSVVYLAAALFVGATLGALGSRIAQAVVARLGMESGEGDLIPVIGALLEGATSALVADFMLFLVLGS